MEPSRQIYLDDSAHGRPFFAHRKEYLRTTGWYGRRDYFSILLIDEGEGRLMSCPTKGRPRSERIAPGRMILLRPSDATHWTPADSSGFSLSFVSFPTTSWRSFVGLTGLDPAWAHAGEPPSTVVDPGDTNIARSFDLAFEQFHGSPTVFDLVQFWASVVPKLVGPPPDPTARPVGAPPWLTESLAEMRVEENLRAGMSRFLQLAHVSAGHLAATTRRYYGCTPIALVTELRLRHAAFLLTGTSDSVGEVADRCGFRRLTYFSSRFRNAYGVSPRAYRAAGAGLPAMAAS